MQISKMVLIKSTYYILDTDGSYHTCPSYSTNKEGVEESNFGKMEPIVDIPLVHWDQFWFNFGPVDDIKIREKDILRTLINSRTLIGHAYISLEEITRILAMGPKQFETYILGRREEKELEVRGGPLVEETKEKINE